MIRRKMSYALIVPFLILVKGGAQDTIHEPANIVVVIAGDIMGHDSQITGAYVDSNGTYDYEPTFRHIRDYFTSADIAVGNLEVTLAGKPFKGYPQFSSPDELAMAARDAGIDILLTANNHSLDRGAKGVKRTIEILDSFNILHTGTFINAETREKEYPLIIEKNDIRIALLNYTYGTNGLRVDTPYVVNRIDTALIRADLAKAKKAAPDITLVTIHWGIEYQRDENKKQQKLARYILAQGADALIGSHPHVVQPIKYLNTPIGDTVESRPVFYSLGNFVSNQRAQYKDGGIVAELHISKKDSLTVLDSLAYLPYWVYRKDLKSKSTFFVVPVAKYEQDSTIVNFNSDNLYKFNRFQQDTRSHLEGVKESTYYHKELRINDVKKQEELSTDL